jgi:TctA family transporter
MKASVGHLLNLKSIKKMIFGKILSSLGVKLLVGNQPWAFKTGDVYRGLALILVTAQEDTNFI